MVRKLFALASFSALAGLVSAVGSAARGGFGDDFFGSGSVTGSRTG
jgi:hypothetical protein